MNSHSQAKNEARSTGGSIWRRLARGATRSVSAGFAGAQGEVVSETRTVADVLRRTRPRATNQGSALQGEAAKVLANSGAASGDYPNLLGHVFERFDLKTYNARHPFSPMTAAPTANNPGFDATRTAGGVIEQLDMKISARSIARAARRSSEPHRVFRAPKDRAAEATRRVAGRAKVEGSSVSSKSLKATTDGSLRRLATNARTATSIGTLAAKAGAVGAAINIGVGGAMDFGHLRRGELDGLNYGWNRAADGIDGAAVGVAGSLAGVAATAAVGGMAVGITTAAFPIVAGFAGGTAASLVMRRYVTERIRRNPTPTPSEDEMHAEYDNFLLFPAASIIPAVHDAATVAAA